MKADLKNAAGVDPSKIAKKVHLATLSNLSNLKSKVDKVDIDKLVHIPVDVSKISDVVKNNVVKKDVYNAKIKNIEDKTPDISNVATNSSLKAKINEFKGEISSVTKVATNAYLNAKINEVKDEILNITNLVSTTALTAAENKMPKIKNLVKKLTITQKLVKLKVM